MENTEARELRIAASFKTSLDQLWEAWTNPEHIVHWWGPKGFTNTIHKMDLQKGGEWKLTMHGPDGTNYPNRSVFMEIIPFKKIVFEHYNPNYIATIIFEEKEKETLMSWTMLFETTKLFETVVKVFKADEGLKQNVEKLEIYLKQNST